MVIYKRPQKKIFPQFYRKFHQIEIFEAAEEAEQEDPQPHPYRNGLGQLLPWEEETETAPASN